MPAKSKKKGELKDASQSIKDAAEGMSMKDVKKFAKTKHKGLPNHVKKHKKALNEGQIFNNAIYIVSDGTSAYEVYGCDYNESEEEILAGPFHDTPNNRGRIEMQVEKFNDEINGTEMLREGSERQGLLRVQRAIYKMVNKNFGSIVRDDAWQNVKYLRDAIQEVPDVIDIEMWAGEYHNYLHSANNNASPYRDYKTVVKTTFGNLGGYIRCCAAGTMNDPFSAYDMVISLYPTKEEELYEGRLRQIVSESINKVLNEGIEVDDFFTMLEKDPRKNTFAYCYYAAPIAVNKSYIGPNGEKQANPMVGKLFKNTVYKFNFGRTYKEAVAKKNPNWEIQARKDQYEKVQGFSVIESDKNGKLQLPLADPQTVYSAYIVMDENGPRVVDKSEIAQYLPQNRTFAPPASGVQYRNLKLDRIYKLSCGGQTWNNPNFEFGNIRELCK